MTDIASTESSERMGMAAIVDLDRYPLDALDSDAGRAWVEGCRAELAEFGSCSLPGFVQPEAVARTVAAGDALADRAWHANQRHNVYFTDPDPSVDEGHPRRRSIRSSQWAIARDLLPETVSVRALSESAEMCAFVAAVVGVDTLYPSADPLDAVQISLFHPGDELGWHFDNSEFSVTLMLRPPEAGGAFEYHPGIRSDADECSQAVRAAIAGDGPEPRVLDTAPGTLAIFKGRHALHRVTPVTGPTSRMNAVLTFGTDPDMCLTADTQRLFYGRRVPAADHSPASA